MPSQEEHFRNNLLRAARSVLESSTPGITRLHQDALGDEGNVEAALAAIKDMHTPEFNRWRRLMISLLDLELAKLRARSSIRLHAAKVETSILDSLQMNAGTWVDYHLSMWLLSMDGLLERAKKLVSQVCRSMIRPSDTAAAQIIEQELLGTLRKLSEQLRPHRNPIAHGGGIIERVGDDKQLEGITLSQVWRDINELFRSHGDYQVQWSESLNGVTLVTFAYIELLFERLNEAVPWERWSGSRRDIKVSAANADANPDENGRTEED